MASAASCRSSTACCAPPMAVRSPSRSSTATPAIRARCRRRSTSSRCASGRAASSSSATAA
jgi:hypothetical protein